MTKEVNLRFEEGSTVIHVTSEDKSNGLKKSFNMTAEMLPSIFGSSWSTGYFSVSQDGPIYLEHRGDRTLVVVQRALRKDQTIVWNRKDLTLTTPWSVFLFGFSPSEDGQYILRDSLIFTTTGPALGGFTRLNSAQWMGNVYNDDRVCWGNTAVSVGGTVSLASATNFANDFFYQPFTPDLARNPERWKEFSETEVNSGRGSHSLADRITRFWRDVS